jgi:hypothetical protein
MKGAPMDRLAGEARGQGEAVMHEFLSSAGFMPQGHRRPWKPSGSSIRIGHMTTSPDDRWLGTAWACA